MFDFFLNPNNIIAIGILIATLTYGFTSFRSGTQKNSGEVIEIYKEQIEAQKIVISDLQAQVNRMQQDIGKLQGLHEANEKKIKEYMDLLGPSGELKQTLDKLASSVHVAEAAMTFMNDVREGKLTFPSPTSVTVKETTVK